MTQVNKQLKRAQRRRRIRARVSGTPQRPRLCVFRSNSHLYLQLIDDQIHVTLAAVSDRDLVAKTGKVKTKTSTLASAEKLGQLIAQKAKKAGYHKIVFDRAGYKFHGQVKAVAEAARKTGLSF